MNISNSDNIHVLHVDDEQEILDVTKTQLEQEAEALTVHTETDPHNALTRLEDEQIDCIVSDYNMRETTGIDFLETVRDDYPNLPFILFTGKGSEEIASEAISAGVTDYLQKQVGPDQYTVLTNRIENAVAQFRAEQELEATQEYYSTILDHSSDFVMIVDEMGDVAYISPAVERVMGYTPDELIGINAFEFTHPEDLEKASAALADVIEQPETEHTVEFRAQADSGDWLWLEVRGRNLLADPVIEGVMVNVRDITARKNREQTLEQQKERLKELTRFMSHDLRNHLNVISIRINTVQDEIESEHLASALENVERINNMVDDIMLLAQSDELDLETNPVDLIDIVEDCWRTIEQKHASLSIQPNGSVIADKDYFKRLLENLLINAIEHGGEDVQITIGRLDNGFYVADDGSGLPGENRDGIFESGFSTGNGSGFGLAIVKEIATVHGWNVTATESTDGGARFEFRNVDFDD